MAPTTWDEVGMARKLAPHLPQDPTGRKLRNGTLQAAGTGSLPLGKLVSEEPEKRDGDSK